MTQDTSVPSYVKAFLAQIGENLQARRESLNLSREDVCRSLKLHINFVIALENGLFEDLPGPAAFFASLRSYSKYLGLNAEEIINECKNNKYLYDALMGAGSIDRGNSKIFVNKVIPSSGEVSSNIPVRQAENSRAENKVEVTVETPEEQVARKKRTKSFVNNFVWSTLALGLLSALTLIYINQTQSFNVKFTNTFPYITRTCSEFKIESSREVYLRVQSISVGAWIQDQKMFPGDEIKFSDSKGIRIDAEDFDALKVIYGKKALSKRSFVNKDGLLVFNCY